jgi:hypothetical protein
MRAAIQHDAKDVNKTHVPLLEGQTMKRSQIRIGDELMLGNGLVEVVSKEAGLLSRPCCIVCRPHASVVWPTIYARPEDLSRPVKIKHSKAQAESLRVARIFANGRHATKRCWDIASDACSSLEVTGGFDALASAILSEVM